MDKEAIRKRVLRRQAYIDRKMTGVPEEEVIEALLADDSTDEPGDATVGVAPVPDMDKEAIRERARKLLAYIHERMAGVTEEEVAEALRDDDSIEPSDRATVAVASTTVPWWETCLLRDPANVLASLSRE
jgi:hypothetical protein